MKSKETPIWRALAMMIMLTMAAVAIAATYNVDNMPNVHKADRSRFVTNPDYIITPMAERHIDSRLRALRDSTTAEVVVVVVDNIDPDKDIDTFATELFESWGLGKGDRDNGLLLLVAKEQHKMAIRTGYGLEGVLPDVACGRLIRNVMAPAFRQGDYDGGLTSAVDIIADVISDPATAAEVISKLPDSDFNPSIDDDLTLEEAITTMGYLGCGAGGALLLVFLVIQLTAGRRSLSKQWGWMRLIRVLSIVGMVIGLGIPVITFLLARRSIKQLRDRHAPCPNCGHKLRKLDEATDNNYLTPAQDLEEQLGSVDYDVWLCDECGFCEAIPFINEMSSYTQCDKCGARTCYLKSDSILQQPTRQREGIGERTYVCNNCRHIKRKRYSIAKLAGTGTAIVGAGLGGLGGGGGGSFGGGFGGGHTGGGGASGGW